MNCNTFTQLWINSKDDLLSAEAQQYLEQCAECRRKVECYNKTLALLKAEPQTSNIDTKMEFAVMSRIENAEKTSAARHLLRRKVWIGAAAACVAALIVNAFLFNSDRMEQRENQAIVEMIGDVCSSTNGSFATKTDYHDLEATEFFMENIYY
ncbi:MAG: hypothetical protein IJQ89_05115 [Bacteroidales bacterium]|nr:hypothetical protein [Bacteroidales bacterium]